MRRSCQGQERCAPPVPQYRPLSQGVQGGRSAASSFAQGPRTVRESSVKGVAMKRFALIGCAVVCLALSAAAPARASWSALCYSGYQPWWNIFACRNKCMTPEEERLQKFWHDYYSALKNYYCDLDHIDWV